MANLYEINQAIAECLDLETGEIIDIEKLSQLTMERDEKIENIGLWIKNLKADIEMYKAESDSFTAKKKAAENKLESLSRYLSDYLDGQKFSTPKVTISFRNTTSVKVADDAELPEEYRRIKTVVEPDKKAIKAALESGAEIDGCVLMQSKSISIK